MAQPQAPPIVGPEGVRAVLDWELAHRGAPMEDLGWFCVNSWRFGNVELEAGGLGTRAHLFVVEGAEKGDVLAVHIDQPVMRIEVPRGRAAIPLRTGP